MRRIGIAVSALALALGSVTPAAADKEDDTLVVAWGATGDIENLDSYFNISRTGIWVSRMLWDSLVFRDPVTFEYKPLLATSWEWVDDLTLEFKLREGVTFHNGEPFDADDVVYTLNFVSKEENGAKVPRNVNWIDTATKVDKYTVQVRLKSPFPQVFEYLSGPVVIYPDEYYSEVGPEGMNEQPIGTGPYKLVDHTMFEEYVFQRNEDYTWGSPKGMPEIGTIIGRNIEDVQTQVAELLAGGIHWTADISADDVEQIAALPGFDAVQAETMRIGYLGMDAQGRSGFEPFKDLKVRRAVAQVVDRQAIVDNLVRGDARIIHTPCYPSQVGCVGDAAVKWQHDVDAAKQLMEEAGYGDGFDVELLYYRDPSWAEAVVADLSKININATARRMPYFSVRDALHADEAQLFLMDWGSYSVNDISAITSRFFTHGPDDYYRDDDVKNWLQTGDTSNDPGVRNENYAKAIERITDRAYWLPMFSFVRNYAFADVVDFKPPVDEIVRFYEFGWKDN